MLRMMSPKEPFSRVVYFTEKIKPNYVVDENDRLVNPKNQIRRVASSVRPQISVNGDHPIAVLSFPEVEDSEKTEETKRELLEKFKNNLKIETVETLDSNIAAPK